MVKVAIKVIMTSDSLGRSHPHLKCSVMVSIVVVHIFARYKLKGTAEC